MKSSTEETEKERALKEVAEATMREKSTTLDAIVERAGDAKRARALAEQKVASWETKLGDMELRLADVESVISSRDKEIADLKVALTEREDKFYNMGFMDVENSSEPVMFQS